MQVHRLHRLKAGLEYVIMSPHVAIYKNCILWDLTVLSRKYCSQSEQLFYLVSFFETWVEKRIGLIYS